MALIELDERGYATYYRVTITRPERECRHARVWARATFIGDADEDRLDDIHQPGWQLCYRIGMSKRGETPEWSRFHFSFRTYTEAFFFLLRWG